MTLRFAKAAVGRDRHRATPPTTTPTPTTPTTRTRPQDDAAADRRHTNAGRVAPAGRTGRPDRTDTRRDPHVATASAARPGRTIAVLAVLTVLVFGLICVVAPDEIGKESLTAGAEVPAAARPRPRGRHQHHPDAPDGQRCRVGAEGLAEPGGRDHPQPGRRLRCRRGRGHHRRATTSSSRSRASRTRTSSPRSQQTAELRFRPVAGGASRRADPAEHAERRPPAAVRVGLAERVAEPARPTPLADARRTEQRASSRGRCAAAGSTTPAPSAPAPTARRRRPAGDDPAPVDAGLARPCRSSSPSSTARNPEKVRQELRTPGPTTRRSRWSPARGRQREVPARPGRGARHGRQAASAGLAQNSQGVPTGGWQVNLKFTGDGQQEVRRRRRDGWSALQRRRRTCSRSCWTAWSSPRPSLNDGPIPGGQAQITGNFTQAEATDLANVLKYGALPLTVRHRRGAEGLGDRSAATSSRPA